VETSRRFGGLLLVTGAAVGVAAVVGLVVGFEPARLPPALLNIAAYKLTFAAAVALLSTGAILGRRGRSRSGESTAEPVSLARDDDGSPPALPAAAEEATFTEKREPERVRSPES
jgi:hypothetical protein